MTGIGTSDDRGRRLVVAVLKHAGGRGDANGVHDEAMAIMTKDLDDVADLAVGIEQQLIELVSRRESLRVAGKASPALDGEIVALQESLGALTERLALT